MGAARKLVHDAIQKMDDGQRTLVLAWAERAQEITSRSDITKSEKLSLLRHLETTPAVKAFIVGLAIALKMHLWDERSWPARGALLGLFVGVAAVGGEGAGIAAMGGAVGVPLFLLTTSGGALLGTIISELTSVKKRQD